MGFTENKIDLVAKTGGRYPDELCSIELIKQRDKIKQQ